MSPSASTNGRPGTPLVPEVGVLALVPNYWRQLWMPRHQILYRLAGYFPVVWVEPSRPWRTLFRGVSTGAAMDPAAPAAPVGMTVQPPEPWLPRVARPEFVGRWTMARRLARARKTLVRSGCKQVVLYIWRPQFAPALDQVAHDLSCYHIDDEYSFSRDDRGQSIAEENLLRRSDQLFIHSPELVKKKGRGREHVSFIPNGVDYELYASELSEPDDIRGIPHPRIGYTGRIKRHLDWELIERIVESSPKHQFVFVGAVAPHPEARAAVARLSRCANAHFLGTKSVNELASYPQHFDVCIMPYRRDEYTKYIYPLKLHEYLASGRPVVGTRIPSLEAFGDVVQLADSAEDWMRNLDAAMLPDAAAEERSVERKAVAARHDWCRLAGEVAEVMASRLDARYVDRLRSAIGR